MELYRSCGGEWHSLASQVRVDSIEMQAFLEFAALFLANVGNYYVSICNHVGTNARVDSD